MKRGIAFIVLCAVFSLTVTSQEFNSGQEVLYDQLKLSVVLDIASWSTVTPQESKLKTWQGYQGSRRISEEEFLNIVGLKDEARKANEHKGFRDFMDTTGMVSCIIGAGLLTLFGISLLHTSYIQFPTTAAMLMGGGLVFVMIGGAPNTLTARQAFSIAESYNVRLKQRLLSSLPIH